MRSFNEIYQEVYAEVGEDLKEIKSSNTTRVLIFIVCIVALIIIGFVINERMAWFIDFFIIALVVVFFVIKLDKQYNKYKKIYKDKVINRFVKGYSDTFEYSPDQGISSLTYNKADFDGYYDRYHSEDLIQGTILENCPISVAEVHTEREETTTDSEGNTTTSYVTLFHGLFACIELNNFNTVCFKILRNKLFSGIFKGKNRLEMDSGEFEKIFDVKTDDKISTLRILTSDVMQMLIDFKSNNKVTPEISLVNNKLFIRFEVGNVFEPNLIKGDMDFDKLKNNYDIINFVFKLAEEFSKNILEFEK